MQSLLVFVGWFVIWPTNNSGAMLRITQMLIVVDEAEVRCSCITPTTALKNYPISLIRDTPNNGVCGTQGAVVDIRRLVM